MPAYVVELEGGKKFRVEADSPPTEQDIQQFLGEESSAKEEPFLDVSDILSAAGGAVKGLPTTVPHAFRQLYSGLDNPWERSTGYEESQKANDTYGQELEAANQAAVESGDISTMSRGMRQAGQSLGFSGGAMAAGLVGSTLGGTAYGAVGRSLGAVAGPGGAIAGEAIGRGAGALAAGYGAAYRMAGAQFLDDARKEVDAKFLQVAGRLPNAEEQAEAYRELKPLAEAFGHAEAGPEAIGNLAMAGAGKYVFGLGKKTIEKLAAGALKKTGAVAGGLATELGGETATQVEQNRIEADKQALLQGQEPVAPTPRTVEEYAQAFKEVAPATLATMGLMSSVPAAMKGASLLRDALSGAYDKDKAAQEAEFPGSSPSAQGISDDESRANFAAGGKPVIDPTTGDVKYLPPGVTLEAAAAQRGDMRKTAEAAAKRGIPVEVDGQVIAYIPPDSDLTPEQVADFAGEPDTLKAMARKGQITLPEIIAPIPGVPEEITTAMNEQVAAAAALAPGTVEALKASEAATPPPTRRQQIQARLAEIENQYGPREDVIVGADGNPTQTRPRRINTTEEDALLKEVEGINAAENTAPVQSPRDPANDAEAAKTKEFTQAEIDAKEKIGEGSESEVYADGDKVLKVSESYNQAETLAERVEYALRAEKLLGNLSGLQYAGFRRGRNGVLNPVFSQRRIDGPSASRAQVQELFRDHGWTENSDGTFYIDTEAGRVSTLSDLYDGGNIIVAEGKVIPRDVATVVEATPTPQVSPVTPATETHADAAIVAATATEVAPTVTDEIQPSVLTPAAAESTAEIQPDVETFEQKAIPKLSNRIQELGGLLTDSEAFGDSEFYDGTFPIPRTGGVFAAKSTNKYRTDPEYAHKVDSAIKDITDTMVRANRQRMILTGVPGSGKFDVNFSVEKARATYGVNVVRAWNNEARQKYPYTSRLGNVSVRESLQNSLDAVLGAIETKQIKQGEISIDTETHDRKGFIVEDNGVGMSDVDIGEKFLSLHSTGKAVQGRFGGFGIAKAVILGPSETATWTLQTRDNEFDHDAAQANEVVRGVPYRQGTKIDVVTQDRIIDDGAKKYVETTELPKNVVVKFNGEAPVYPFKGMRSPMKKTVKVNDSTSYDISYYPKAPEGYENVNVIRLVDQKTGAKLTQSLSPAGSYNFKGAFVIDITTTATPGSSEYPLTDSRMEIKYGAPMEAIRGITEKVAVDPYSTNRGDVPSTMRNTSDMSEWKDTIADAYNPDGGYHKLFEVISNIWEKTGQYSGSSSKPITRIEDLRIKVDTGYKGYRGGTTFHAKHLAAYEAVSRLMAPDAGARVTEFYGMLSKSVDGSTRGAEHAAGGVMGFNFLNIDKTALKSPVSYALYLRDLVAHELTHDFHDRHNEEFTSKEIEVQRATAHLFPDILKIAEATLGQESGLGGKTKTVTKTVEKRVEVPVIVEKVVEVEAPKRETTPEEKYLPPQQLQFIYENAELPTTSEATDDLYYPRQEVAGNLWSQPIRTSGSSARLSSEAKDTGIGSRTQQSDSSGFPVSKSGSVGAGAVDAGEGLDSSTAADLRAASVKVTFTHSTKTEPGKGQQSGYFPGTYAYEDGTPEGLRRTSEGEKFTGSLSESDIYTAQDAEQLKKDAAKAGFGYHTGNGNAEVKYLQSLGYKAMRRGSTGGTEIIVFDHNDAGFQRVAASPAISADLRAAEATNTAYAKHLGLPTAPTVVEDAGAMLKQAMQRAADSPALKNSPLLRMIAKILARLDFAGLSLEVVAEGKGDFAGSYNSATQRVMLDLRAVARDNLTLPANLIHELLHHFTMEKIANPLTAVERRAVAQLEKIRAGVEQYLKQQGLAEKYDYEIGSLREFVTHLGTREDFVDLLKNIPANFVPRAPGTKFRSVLSDISRWLAELLSNRQVERGSALEQAMEAALALVQSPQHQFGGDGVARSPTTGRNAKLVASLPSEVVAAAERIVSTGTISDEDATIIKQSAVASLLDEADDAATVDNLRDLLGVADSNYDQQNAQGGAAVNQAFAQRVALKELSKRVHREKALSAADEQWIRENAPMYLGKTRDATLRNVSRFYVNTLTSESDHIAHTMAGEKAEVPQFMRDSLETAKAMAAAGKTSEEIRAVTGWFPGKYDGKMRWEVPDEGAKLHKDWQSKDTVGEAIDHPDLFRAYPEARDIYLKELLHPGMEAASYQDGVIRFRKSANLSILLHEVQHWIQEQEGFAKGGDFRMAFADPRMGVGSKEGIRGATRILKRILANMRKPLSMEEFAKSAWQSDVVTPEIEESYKEYLETKKKAGTDYNLERLAQETAAKEWYRNLAGEIEARDVQARQNFTPEQRKAIAPYSSENIAKEDAIVMFGSNGPQESRGYRSPADLLAETAGKLKGEAAAKPGGLSSMFNPKPGRPATGERTLFETPKAADPVSSRVSNKTASETTESNENPSQVTNIANAVDAATNAVKTATSIAEASPTLETLTVDELKQVARNTGYPATGSKKELVQRLLSAVNYRASAVAIRGDAVVPNVPVAQRTPEQQARFDEEMRQAEAAAPKALKVRKPDRSQEAFNRNMGAIRSSPLDLAAAYQSAAQGSSTSMLPLDAVFAAAQAVNPSLTEAAFIDSVKQAYDAGTVLLEGAGSQREADNAGMTIPGMPVGTVVRMMVPESTSPTYAAPINPAQSDEHRGGTSDPATGGSQDNAPVSPELDARRKEAISAAVAEHDWGNYTREQKVAAAESFLTKWVSPVRALEFPADVGIRVSVGDGSGANVTVHEVPSQPVGVVVNVGQSRVIDKYANLAPEQVFAHLYDSAQEEIIHVAHYLGIYRQWQATRVKGDTTKFLPYLKRKLKETFDQMNQARLDLQQTNPAAAQKIKDAMLASWNLYHRDDPVTGIAGLWNRLEGKPEAQMDFTSEMVRMLTQLKRQDFTTETGWQKFRSMLAKWLTDAINALRGAQDVFRSGMAGDLIQRQLADLEAALDGRPLPPGPATKLALDVRFAELTASLPEEMTAEDIATFKAEHPAEYAELEAMRAEVLKAGGWDVGPVYHGTYGGVAAFDDPVFNTQRAGGVWFSTNREYADGFARGRSDAFYVKADNILDVDLDVIEKPSEDDVNGAVNSGYDALRYEGQEGDSDGGQIFVFDPNQIKSADPLSPGPKIPPSQWGDDSSPLITRAAPMRADTARQREADKVFGVMKEDDRFEEGVDMYDRLKAKPSQPSAGNSTPPRFTNAAQFAAEFEAAFLRGDFDYFLEALKQSDRHIYVPEMKKYLLATKLDPTDKYAADRLDWFRSAIAGTVPATAKPQTKTKPPPPPAGAAATPPPPAATPPPPAATPPPKAGVSNRPMLTLNPPAMGLIARMLGAGIRINELLRRARGTAVVNFADGSELQLSEHLFKDPVQAAKTLAHEIGHLFDAMPASGIGQKLAGRIAPLGDFRKVFGDDLADWSMEGGKKMKLSKINSLILAELVALSKKWRGDFTYKPGTYRSKGSELYADFISAILNDPQWAAKNAPYSTLGFLNALEDQQKPEVDEAYRLVVSLVQGGSLYKALAEADETKSTTALERLIAKSSALMRAKKTLNDATRGLYRSMFGKWLPTAIRDGGIWKSYWKRIKSVGTLKDYNWAQEEASQFAVRQIARFDDAMANAVGVPMKLAGISPEYLQRLQTNNRIIHERRRVGVLIEQDPAKARELLKWMIDAGLLGQDVQDEVDGAADADLYAMTAKVIYKLHENGESFERALKAARRKDAPADAEKALYAFDVSGFMLNPNVHTMETAEADNADLKQTLGPNLFGELERINEGYHDLIKRTMIEANNLGLFRPSTWEDVIVPNFGVYVPFMPIKYFTGRVGGGIGPARVGTAHDLIAPHVVGTLKMHALIHRMQRQKQAHILLDFFNTNGFSNDLEPVEDENFDQAKADELTRHSKHTISYLPYWDNGEYKWVKINGTDAVPLVQNSDPDDLAALYKVMRSNTNLWRLNFTIFSIGFNINNALRNIASPAADIGPKAGYRAAKQLLSAFPHMAKWVWAKVRGKDPASLVAASIAVEHARHRPGMVASKELQEFYDRNILQPMPDVASLRMTEEELARSVMGAMSAPEFLLQGVHKPAKDANWYDNTIKRQVHAAVDFLSFIGSVSEAAPKIAAYQTLKEKKDSTGAAKFTDAEATYLATLEGIPRPSVAGAHNATLEMVLMFFRVAVQSWRKHLVMATQPKTRAGFLMRHMLFEGAKFGLQAMAANGAIDYLIAMAAAAGDDDDDPEKHKQVDWAEAMGRQSSYKLSRGGIGPLICWVLPDGSIEPPWGHKTIPADWTPIMPRLPGTELSREADPLAYYVTSKTLAPSIAPVNEDMFWNDFMRTIVPALNPSFDVVSDAMSVVGPTPPRDSYRGRDKVEQRIWDEGYVARLIGLGEHHLKSSFGIGSNSYDTQLPGAWNVLKQPGFKSLITSDNMVGVREEQRARRENDLTSSFAQNMVGEKFGVIKNTFNRLKAKETPKTPQEEAIYKTLGPIMSRAFYGTEKRDGLYDVLQRYARMRAKGLQDTSGGKVLKAEAEQAVLDLETIATELQPTLEYLRTHTLP
jgi:hypothetical protein